MDAGWFPDPNDPTTERYWDGVSWSEQARPVATPPPPPPEPSPTMLAPGVPWSNTAPNPQVPPAPPGAPGWSTPAATPPTRSRGPLIAAIVAVLLIAAGVTAWLLLRDDDTTTADPKGGGGTSAVTVTTTTQKSTTTTTQKKRTTTTTDETSTTTDSGGGTGNPSDAVIEIQSIFTDAGATCDRDTEGNDEPRDSIIKQGEDSLSSSTTSDKAKVFIRAIVNEMRGLPDGSTVALINCKGDDNDEATDPHYRELTGAIFTYRESDGAEDQPFVIGVPKQNRLQSALRDTGVKVLVDGSDDK
jgi:hypothetical protein